MKGLLVPCLGSPTRHQETLRVERYSVPAPTGGTTGSFCAQMRAKGYRPQPRHGSSAIAATADGSDDGHALPQLTGGVFLDSRRPRPSAPFSCLPETVDSMIPHTNALGPSPSSIGNTPVSHFPLTHSPRHSMLLRMCRRPWSAPCPQHGSSATPWNPPRRPDQSASHHRADERQQGVGALFHVSQEALPCPMHLPRRPAPPRPEPNPSVIWFLLRSR